MNEEQTKAQWELSSHTTTEHIITLCDDGMCDIVCRCASEADAEKIIALLRLAGEGDKDKEIERLQVELTEKEEDVEDLCRQARIYHRDALIAQKSLKKALDKIRNNDTEINNLKFLLKSERDENRAHYEIVEESKILGGRLSCVRSELWRFHRIISKVEEWAANEFNEELSQFIRDLKENCDTIPPNRKAGEIKRRKLRLRKLRLAQKENKE